MSLKSRIEALTTQISNAKASLRSALSNKGVSVPISPTWDEITQGINDIENPSNAKSIIIILLWDLLSLLGGWEF